MATIINVDQRVGVLVLLAAVLVVWAVVYPESFSNSVDTAAGIIDGAISGAQGAA